MASAPSGKRCSNAMVGESSATCQNIYFGDHHKVRVLLNDPNKHMNEIQHELNEKAVARDKTQKRWET
eukprot:1722205-Amphidinium_carterae.1